MSVTLISADSQRFAVDAAVAAQSVTIQNTVEEIGGDEPVPLPNVSGAVLARVIEFCTSRASHQDPADPADPATDARSEFDASFVADLKADHAMMFDLIMAANYLNIKPLLDLLCRTAADMISGKTVEEIRDMFGIQNDFTPEEEERVRQENQWAFE